MAPVDAAPRRYALAALAYTVITAGLFHNLLPVASTRVYSDLGDALLNTSILAWNAAHVPLSPGWWNYPAFAPLSGVTAWTEHLIAAYPLTTPLVWATGSPVLAYNVLLMVCFPLNGVSMFALARELTGSDLGAFVAGLAFAFAPYQAGQLAHVQMLLSFGMPLALLGLHRYLAGGDRRGLVWFAAGWLVTVLSNAYMLVLFPILVALWCVWCGRGADRSGRRLPRLLPTIAVAGLVMLAAAPLFWGYYVRQAAYGFVRPYDEIRAFGADVRSLAVVSTHAVLWSRWLRISPGEAALFPGLATLALGAIGVASRGRDAWARRDPVVCCALGAVGLWLCALGPEPSWNGAPLGIAGPYRALLLIPGANSIRVPARAWLPAALCLAVTAGAGAEWLTRRARGRWMAWAFAVVIVAEGWFGDATFLPPRSVPFGPIPAGAVVLDLPIDAGAGNVPAEYLAVVGGYRAINGYSGYAPPHFARLREALASHEPAAFDAFRRLDDLYVIARPAVDARFTGWLESQPGALRVSTTPAWTIYRLPHIGAAPPADIPVPLPSPGAVAFQLR